MKNDVLDASLASRTVARGLEGRRAVYADEVRRLVEASFELIRRTGELEPRVSEIVNAAGLSNQAFYRHFRSKDELLLTVLDEGVGILASYLRHRMEKVASPRDRVREWVGGMLEQALDGEAAAATRPFAVSKARLAELFPEEVEASERRLTALLREALEAAVAAGELPHADPERDAEILYELSMGWMQRRVAQSGPTARVDAESLLDFAMHGLHRSGRVA